MLMATSAAWSRARYCGLVKWLPWSLFGDLGRGLGQGTRGGGQDEGQLQGQVQLPADHVARVPVEHGDQVEPARLHLDIGHVNAPDVVGPGAGHVAQQVGIHGMPGRGRAQMGAGRNASDAHLGACVAARLCG